MKIIDFDGKFSEYLEKWLLENSKKYKKMDEIEEIMPDIYMNWLEQPAAFIGGVKPGEYFNKFDDPNELLEMMKEYDKQRISVPDMLLERIADIGEPSVAPLMQLVMEGKNRGQVMSAMNLLVEIGSATPMQMCIDIIAAADSQNELTEVATEMLNNMGDVVVQPILNRLDGVSDAAEESFLDVLCSNGGDDRIVERTVDAFNRRFERRALYASFLEKLGDARAIPALEAAIEQDDINYLDYIECVNAIESLGGEVKTMREFNGDPAYEAMKKMK